MILDTNAVSALAKDERGILAVLTTAAPPLVLPVIVIGEYRYGIAQSNRGPSLTKWLESFIADCTVLDVVSDTTHYYAAISLELRRIGKPIPDNDLWIAALCRQHGLPLLSRDGHFDVVRGLKRISW